MNVKVGDIYRELDTRMLGRHLKVVAVFEKGSHYLEEGYVACASRGKVTVISLERLLDTSRFEPVAVELATVHG